MAVPFLHNSILLHQPDQEEVQVCMAVQAISHVFSFLYAELMHSLVYAQGARLTAFS